MGYTTQFSGQFNITPVLTGTHKTFLEEFAEKPHENTIPSGYCQWVPNDVGSAIEWDGGEKFYEYIPWMGYLLENFLIPWGYTVNGEVKWQGEEIGDIGTIIIVDNKISHIEHSNEKTLVLTMVDGLADFIANRYGIDYFDLKEAIDEFIDTKM